MSKTQVTKIALEGIQDKLVWLVIFSAMLLATSVQALKALDVKPPLSVREITVRSLGAGVTALTLGLMLLGAGKIAFHWALYIGLGGVIGYWGQEALAYAVYLLRQVAAKRLGVPADPPARPKDEGGGTA